jgi:hypothetical protein
LRRNKKMAMFKKRQKPEEEPKLTLLDYWGRPTRISPKNLEKFGKQQEETRAKAEAGELKDPKQTAAENIEKELGKEAGDFYKALMGLK